ncbi:cleavage/polyadenylation specificity factor, 25kDa subunit [Tanacetum coccineum]
MVMMMTAAEWWWWRGGAWCWGSDRSGGEKQFWTWPENSPEKFSGGRRWRRRWLSGGRRRWELAGKDEGERGALASDSNLRSCLSGRGGLGGSSDTRRDSRVAAFSRIRVDSWNVGSLTGKILELFDALDRHKVDIAYFQETKWKGGGSVVPRILWRNLNGDATEAFRTRVVEGVSTQVDVLSTSDAVSMWNILASTIKDVVKDPLELAIGTSKTYTAPQVKEKAYEELYKKLDSKEGANDISKIEKAQERRRRDLGDICFIKDEGGQTITDEEEIKKRWGEYFSSLFSAREPEGHEEVVEPSITPQLNIYHSRISEAEVRTSL